MEITLTSGAIICIHAIIIFLVFWYQRTTFMDIDAGIEIQPELDEESARLNTEFGIEFQQVGLDVIMSRKRFKSFLILLPIALIGAVIAIFIDMSINMRLVVIGCALITLISSMIALAESKIFAIALIAVILVFGFFAKTALDAIIMSNPYAFFYLVGFIMIFGIGWMLMHRFNPRRT